MSRNTQQPRFFRSVAEFMESTGLSDTQLAAILKVDRSEVTRLRQGRKYRSLVMPLRVSRVCRVPIERLAPPNVA